MRAARSCGAYHGWYMLTVIRAADEQRFKRRGGADIEHSDVRLIGHGTLRGRAGGGPQGPGGGCCYSSARRDWEEGGACDVKVSDAAHNGAMWVRWE